MVVQLPKIRNLPKSLALESVVRIELSEGIPVFKASLTIQNRIEDLLFKQRENDVTEDEEKELLFTSRRLIQNNQYLPLITTAN